MERLSLFLFSIAHIGDECDPDISDSCGNMPFSVCAYGVCQCRHMFWTCEDGLGCMCSEGTTLNEDGDSCETGMHIQG